MIKMKDLLHLSIFFMFAAIIITLYYMKTVRVLVFTKAWILRYKEQWHHCAIIVTENTFFIFVLKYIFITIDCYLVISRVSLKICSLKA